MKPLYRIVVFLLAVVLAIPASASAKPLAWKFGERTLKQGHKGKDVTTLQRYLVRVGIKTDVDGVFGSGTRKAVRIFEVAQRRTVDGAVSRFDARVIKDVAVNGGAVVSAAATGGAVPRSVKLELPPPELPAPPPPLVLGPGMIATVGADGLAIAPELAPPEVKAVIDAGNKIAKTPYLWGGGHGKWEDSGYDCSGSVSYALHGAGLLETSMASGGFMDWGDKGPGQWITVYANGGHMYMVVAGLRFDTSGRASAGTRWQADPRPTQRYVVSHPTGL